MPVLSAGTHSAWPVFLCFLVSCAGGPRGRGPVCVLSGSEQDPKSHLALGICWEREGRQKLALSEYRKALAQSPHDTEAREKLALGYLQDGDDMYAAREFLILLNDDPKNVTALYKLGTIFYRQGKDTLAISSFSRVLEIDPEYSKAWYNLGAIYANRSEPGRAERCFRMYLAQVPVSEEGKAVEQWMRTHGADTHLGTEEGRPLPLH